MLILSEESIAFSIAEISFMLDYAGGHQGDPEWDDRYDFLYDFGRKSPRFPADLSNQLHIT